MNTQQLDYLKQAVKAGSFSRAADILGLSQSRLSRQVAALEQEMGCPLLRRHGRGVAATAAGERLLALAETFLQEVARLKSAGAGRGLQGEFKLGVPMFFSQSLAPDLMAAVRSRYPGLSFTVREGPSGDLHDWLLAGELSAAVIHESKRPRQLEGDALFLEPVFVVGTRELARRHGLPLDRGLSLRELARLPILVPTRRHGTRLDFDALMRRHRLTPDIVHEVDALGARMLLARSGAGVTIFESAGLLAERKDPSLFVLPLADPAFFHRLVWVDAREPERGAQWRGLLRFLKRGIVRLRQDLGDGGPAKLLQS
ncbi:LysR family transcriptional regulator [Bordetella pseudohinzii]|uniref:Cyn operon transcriptional activator n=1 Tax=Bordetella pseudohinzii TaxID=1331258 RepID=A0A0J6BUW6_9BORD|nr:LysR family transcriptional regulator [Bordetella pseudohinzii]ANY17388.1 hypothetical protein BBN53_16800 [Bordetella pseudohinzii]KMM25604.1 hypothetical protein L540_18385 [Bordetella pseudohinzii]KXA81604.1 hypothetical protein AW878_03200 [Bordetella pseudohinzii]KXA83155.1 hypothetical protein AW877_01155 [Bordetella pseudohinzii]CUI70186.1 Cyn operon transcriptional activator [Bordetella pseudohinzii]